MTNRSNRTPRGAKSSPGRSGSSPSGPTPPVPAPIDRSKLSQMATGATPLFAICLATTLLIKLCTLGGYPLTDSTEGRYAEIGREMLVSGNWIMPHLDPGVPFWGKPPLSFWASGISFATFGLNEFAARIPSFLFSIIALLAVYRLSRNSYGDLSGWKSALILSSCGLFIVMCAGVLTDPSLMSAVTVSLFGFCSSMVLRKQHPAYGYCVFLGLGLGILAKGLIGIIIPGIAMFFWTLIFWEWRSLRRLPWVGGLVLLAALVIPWHLLAERNSPGYLEYYIVGEHYLRFVDRGWAGDLYGNPHDEPKGMIWLFAIIATFPWCLILAHAAWKLEFWKTLARDRVFIFALLWFLSPMILFTMSDNVIITYILPGLPGFAIMAERLIRISRGNPETRTGNHTLGASNWKRWNLAIPATALATALLVAMIMLFVVPGQAEKRSQRQLVSIYEGLRSEAHSELLYFDEKPYSGDFYSDGMAREISMDRPDLLAKELGDSEQDFYAVDDDDLDKFPIADTRIYSIGIIGEFTLFGEYPFRRASND